MKNNKVSLLTKNMLTNSFGTVLLKSIPLITIPIISAILTPEEYGKVSIFLTWIAFLGVFIGIQVNGSLQNALNRFEEKDFNKYCSSILSLAFLSFIVFFVPFLILKTQISSLLGLDELMVIMLIPTCFGSFCISFCSSYFLCLKKAKYNLLVTFFTTLTVAVASLVSAKFAYSSYLGYVLGYSIPYISIGTIFFVIFLAKNWCLFDKNYWKFCILFSLPLVFHMLSNTVLSQSDKLMIQYIKEDVSGVGVYNMMHTVSSLVNSLWGAMNSAFVPFYYEYLKDNNIDELKRRTINYSFIFTCITGGFLLVCPEITSLLLNEQYHSGINLLPLMILSNYFVFLYSFSVNYEFFNEKTIWVAMGTLLTAIINIVLNYFLLGVLGIFGVALATCISYFLLFIFHEIIARKRIKNYPVPITFMLICATIMFIIFGLTYLFFNLVIVRWVLFAIIVFIFFFRIIKTKTII